MPLAETVVALDSAVAFVSGNPSSAIRMVPASALTDRKETAHYWIRRAEELAGIPHQTRGGWHALRRAWAAARKHMPLQDVMMAGGWKDPASLQRAYQHADARTVRAVMDLGA